MAGSWSGNFYRGDDTSERVVGTDIAEIIWGEGGNDTLLGGGGRDTIRGDAGRDHIDGGAGRDMLIGATGDRFLGGDGNDLVRVEDDPELAVAGAATTVDGGAGRDSLALLYQQASGENVRFVHDDGGFFVTRGGATLAEVDGFESYTLSLTGSGDDFVKFGAGDDVVYADGGDDTVSAGAGDDWVAVGIGKFDVKGGAGKDVLAFSLSERSSGVKLQLGDELEFSGNRAVGFEQYNVDGSDFADRIVGTDRSDSLSGGAGADTLLGGAGNDAIYDQDYDDRAGKDRLFGGDGDDVMGSYGGADRLEAASGDDIVRIYLDSGRDTALGGKGDDQLQVLSRTGFPEEEQAMVAGIVDGRFVVTLDGETIIKASGFESYQLFGGTKGDRLSGGGGDDLFYGAEGVDTIDGGGGSDLFHLSPERQAVIVRLDGDQTVTTATGETVDEISGVENVYATNHDDVIVGNGASNRMIGGSGSDTMTGGGGKDVFGVRLDENVFTPGDEADTIRDFTSGTDRLELDAFAIGDIDPGDIKPGAFRLGASALDADDRYVYDRASGGLFFDEDGAGGEAQHLIARLGAGTRLTADDLFVGGG